MNHALPERDADGDTAAPGLFALFVRAELLSFLAGAVLIAGYLASLHPFPAPRIGSGYSFNEKARWLRHALERHSCDVLVLGSSVALNGVDSAELAAAYPGATVVNAAYWGGKMSEDEMVLRILSRLCRPKVVILPVTWLDFKPGVQESNWTHYEKYVGGQPTLEAYLEAPDLLYYIHAGLYFAAGQTLQPEGRRRYLNLYFDQGGAVLLSVEGFVREPRRWDGYLEERRNVVDGAGLEALGRLAAQARQLGARLVVSPIPMRPIAEKTFFPAERVALWQSVQAQIRPQGGEFLVDPRTSDFGDALHADYDHLNAAGAKTWTRWLAGTLTRAGQGEPAAATGPSPAVPAGQP